MWLNIDESLAALVGAIWGLFVRLLCLFLLPLAPLFALLEMRSERKENARYEAARQKLRAGIHKNGTINDA
jgi:hypothetical protein